MPEMDGLQATRALRARGGKFATVPIIAITANAFAEDAKACLQAGMNDFVTKPVRKKVLVGAILRAMRGGKHGAADGRRAGEATPSRSDQAAPAQAASLVDRVAVEELVAEIGEAAASEAFHLFVAETESRLKLLRQLTCTADRPAIENEAHALKGSAATFGLREVSQLAGRLEREAARIAAAEYGTLLDRLEAAFAASRTQFPVGIPIAA
jgi:CheY-like chemotaxis protein